MSYSAEARRAGDRRTNREISMPPYQTASGCVLQDRRSIIDRRASGLRAWVLDKPETALQALFRAGSASATGKLPDALKIGHSGVDRDHRDLMHILWQMKQIAEGQSTESIHELLSRLSNRLCKHFTEEEFLMRQLGIPEKMFREHQADHNQIIEEMSGLYFEALKRDLPDTKLILAKAERWVVMHLVAYDLYLKEYMSQQEHSAQAQ